MPKRRTRRRNMKGKGVKEILGKVKNALGVAKDFVKKHKLISRGLAAVTPFAGTFAPLTSGASAGVAALGYGRRRRVGRPRRR